jgi:hypothetical protein
MAARGFSLRVVLRAVSIALCLGSASLLWAQDRVLSERPLRVDWAPALFAAPLLVLFLFLLWRYGFAQTTFLCDTCLYNDARYCQKPERPNAERCSDFKGR